MNIRKENYSDYKKVYHVNCKAFKQNDEADLVNALRKSDAFIPELSLVAELDSKIVGHILFTKLKIIDEVGSEVSSLALSPMGVLPEFQRKGIGGKLIKHGLKKTIELRYQSVIILGHENYYPKFGFAPTLKWNIKAPFKVPDNVFMGIELTNGSLKYVNGTVHYAKEFGIE